MEFELIGDESTRTLLGESPVWDPRANALWWVDVDGRKLVRLTLGSKLLRTWETPETPGFVVLTAGGLPALGMETGIFAFDADSAAFDRIIAFDIAGGRFNDATVDARGRLWASTMALDAQAGKAAIHLVTTAGNFVTIAERLSIPNGLAVDIDRGRLFYSDSHPEKQCIWVRRLESDPVESAAVQKFSDTGELAGRPDGAAFDARGFYWIAGVDGSQLYVFDLEGHLDDVIDLPFAAPTKIAFWGAEGRNIAITSKAIGEAGGYLALAALPEGFAPGVVQPCWTIGAA